MPSWLSPSPSSLQAESHSLARRFVEASRRAEIVALVNEARTEREVAGVAVDEFAEAFDAEVVFVVVTRPRYGERETIGYTGMSAERASAISAAALCLGAAGATRAIVHTGEDLLEVGAIHVAVSPWTAASGGEMVIGVGRLYDEPFDAAELALLEAVTASVGHGLERAWLSAERDRQAERQAALARAARSVGASLERPSVLEALAREVARGLGADVVTIYEPGARGQVRRLVTGVGLIFGGHQTAEWPGARLSEQAVRTGTVAVHQPSEEHPLAESVGAPALRSGAAAPIRQRGIVEGVVLVAYHGDRWIEQEDLDLLAAFTELGALACRNAADLAAAQQAAALDSLTHCSNHGAFQDRLREEISRSQRDGSGPALVLLDLNDFKQVNDTFGHVVGDALLRAFADALRASVRTYDQVARYGGDEFALLLPATDIDTARRVVDRAFTSITRIELPVGINVSASAGLAQWSPGMTAAELVDAADQAMFESKRARRRAHNTHRAPGTLDAAAGGRDRHQLERLTTAVSLGARLGRLLDQRQIVETVVIELGSALGYESCALVRRQDDEVAVVATGSAERYAVGSDVVGAGHFDHLIAALRRCSDERRTLLLGSHGQDAEDPRSRLVVPVYAGEALWGALGVSAGDELDAYDVQVLQGVADQLGAALQTAELYEELDQTHLGTAAALAAALEAKDHYTADHARAIADSAVAVGKRLGLAGAELRDLRYGAIFHDIGKIAIPDVILNKTESLTESEYAVVREHPRVGGQILAPVPFLAGVRQIVRHDHERWDGRGYPDGLHGDDIPLGARIVLVVDAYHAMRTDRPYRSALSEEAARDELLANAGSQFDPQVVRTFLELLDEPPG